VKIIRFAPGSEGAVAPAAQQFRAPPSQSNQSSSGRGWSALGREAVIRFPVVN
jgi:hypothetical protein